MKKKDYSHINATVSDNPVMWGGDAESDSSLTYAARFRALLRCEFPGVNVTITSEEFTNAEDQLGDIDHEDAVAVRAYMERVWTMCCEDSLESVLDETLGAHNTDWSCAWALGYKHTDGRPMWLVDDEGDSYSLTACDLNSDDVFEGELVQWFDDEEELLAWLVPFVVAKDASVAAPAPAPSVAHSPAPWKLGSEYGVSQDEIEDAEGRTLAVVWTRRGPNNKTAHPRPCYKDDPMGCANRDLIIAAPAMLAALEKIDANAAESVDWIRRVAREAIAAAKGGK